MDFLQRIHYTNFQWILLSYSIENNNESNQKISNILMSKIGQRYIAGTPKYQVAGPLRDCLVEFWCPTWPTVDTSTH